MENENVKTDNKGTLWYSLIKENSSIKEKIKRERFITHTIYLIVIVIIILLLRDCSGKKEAAYEAQLQVKNDSINLLKQQLADCENRKAIPIVITKTNDEIVTTAIIVKKNDIRPSILSIKIEPRYYPKEIPVPCPEFICDKCPEYPELKDSCIVDTIDASITETNCTDSSKKDLFCFEGFRLYQVYVPNLKLNYPSCFGKFPGKINYSYSYNKVSIDKDLIKRAKIENWVGMIFRAGGMFTYSRLYHSDKQFAVTVNGVGPYEDGNPLKESNLRDKKIAKNKGWLEVGGLVSYAIGEGLGVKSQIDYGNAYSSEMMTMTFNINF